MKNFFQKNDKERNYKMKNISLILAKEIIDKAIEEANILNISITATIVDLGGHIVSSSRMDGASYISNDTSLKKAMTACNFKTPTHFLKIASVKFPELEEALKNNVHQVSTLPGGMPIKIDDTCIGGLGISGGNFSQDQEICEKALLNITSS